jgi:uncharacterized protein
MVIEINRVDTEYYQERINDFLPKKIIDFHTHVWLKTFRKTHSVKPRGKTWPLLIAEENSIENLISTYDLMFPHQQITPVIFGWPERDVDLDETNNYISEVSSKFNLPSLIVTTPLWKKRELYERVVQGKFLGLKPYLSWAPENIPSNEITIYDFLPKHHLEIANQNGWIVLLHIPRSQRLRDPVNLKHMLEIEDKFPNIKLIIAHIGRAYCQEDLGNALEILEETKNMVFDFSGNTNQFVMKAALETFGSKRLIFGSDLPIVRMRMRRICEEGVYVNLVPPGIYGDLSGDPHMREVNREDGENLSFFLYESINALRVGADELGLTAEQISDVFFNNANRILESVKWTT